MSYFERIELTEGGWLDGVQSAQAEAIRKLLKSGRTEEEVGELWLATPGPVNTAGFGSLGPMQNFYANVKKEFISFVCGNPDYDEERAKVQDVWEKQGKIGLVSMVAAVVASTLGLAVAAIVPVVALLFSLVAKIGVNAFCETCGHQ